MSTTAEILIKSKDQYTKLTDQAKRDIVDLGRQTKASMAQAKDATDILKDTLGIQLPRELTKIVAHSKLIGPALAASFDVIAAVGFIAVLQQIPDLYNKLAEAVTGWDEKSRAAHKNFLEDNKKALESAEKFRLKMIEIESGAGKALEEKLKALQLAATALQSAAASPAKPEGRLQQASDSLITNLTFGLYNPATGRNKEESERLQGLANAKGNEVLEAQRELLQHNAEEAKKISEELKKIHEDYRDFFAKAAQEFRTRTGGGGEDVKEGEAAAKHAVEQIIADWKEMGNLLQAAGDELIKNRNYWDNQLQSYRDQSATGGPFAEDIKAGEKAADITKDRVIKAHEEIQRKTEEFIRSFREGAGHVWDDFYTKGASVLGNLANVAKGLLNTIGRTLFQDFATGLLTGGRSSGAGIGSAAANLGASFGLGKLFGGAGGGLLGGLLGGGAAAGTAATTASIGAFAGIAGAGGALAPGAIAAPSMAGGGLGASMGALFTNPWTAVVAGGIIGGALLWKHFHHGTEEAPFTRDPNSVQQSREFFFYTGATALADAARDLKSFGMRMGSIPAGQVVLDGMPAALESSNQFRRDMASVLVDDV